MWLFLFQFTGQPVLIGGTMGTCSYVLTGTEQGMSETFGSTCHGAVRYCPFFYDIVKLSRTRIVTSLGHFLKNNDVRI